MILTWHESLYGSFANGFQDVSGKGVRILNVPMVQKYWLKLRQVMISYIIQTVLTGIFGPLLPIIIRFIRLSPWQSVIRSEESIRSLQSTVYDISSFFCISVFIAALVRNRQLPCALEIFFMNKLLVHQYVVVGSMLCARVFDFLMNAISLDWAGGFYHLALSIALLVWGFVAIPSGALRVYHDLATNCDGQRQFVDISRIFTSRSKNFKAAKWIFIGLSIGVGCIILSLVFKGGRKIYQKIYELWHRIILAWLRKHLLFSILPVPCLLLLLFYLIRSTIELNQTRKVVRNKSRDGSKDDEWGYGQTTAVLLWLPIIWAPVKQKISQCPIKSNVNRFLTRDRIILLILIDIVVVFRAISEPFCP